MKTTRIIQCGLGNVGRNFLNLLNERAGDIREKYGLNIEVSCVVDIGGAALNPTGGLPLERLLCHLQNGGKPEQFEDYGRVGLTGVQAIEDYDFDILIETTPTNLKDGEPANSFITAALAKGTDVVSANKGPFVLFFDKLKKAAKKNNSRFFVSAAAGAALPTLDVGRFSTLGARVTAIEGILNGTTNYILTKMHLEKCSYQEALAQAQALGIAETDPSLDVGGFDTRNKILLISNMVFDANLRLEDIPVQGIVGITLDDIEQTAREGNVLKLVATAQRFEDGRIAAEVKPKAIPPDHPLAAINYSEKGITYTTDTMGQITVLGGKSSPLGAAAALLKDIIQAHLFDK